MSFLTLPNELLDLLAPHLPYTSQLALQWTCRYLYLNSERTIPPRWRRPRKRRNNDSGVLLRMYKDHFTDMRPDDLPKARQTPEVEEQSEEEEKRKETYDDEDEAHQQQLRKRKEEGVEVARRGAEDIPEAVQDDRWGHAYGHKLGHAALALALEDARKDVEQEDGWWLQPQIPTPVDRRRCMYDILILETWPCFSQHSPATTLSPCPPSPGPNSTTAISSIEKECAPSRPSWNLYACACCLTLLPRSHFAYAQTRSDRAKAYYSQSSLLVLQASIKDDNPNTHSHATAVEGRFCIPCGVRDGRYQKGTLLRFTMEGKGGERQEESEGRDGTEKVGTGIVCKRCGDFKEVGRESKAALRRLCERCLKYRPP